ncbi:hypothetical protein MRS44_013150 [Fusarium solani]|uniref:uncharacterized protein n=1 Tax=Fusarium solani TaxID=169388 RepID=UPI0032C426B0|nr:hypothetical protein MRS44_013150 [Fusarium solani]
MRRWNIIRIAHAAHQRCFVFLDLFILLRFEACSLLPFTLYLIPSFQFPICAGALPFVFSHWVFILHLINAPMAGFVSLTAWLLIAFAPNAWASCAYGTLLHPRAEGGTVEVNDFGYTGKTGPTNWVALDPEANALCSTGKNQSPIDMVSGSFTTIPAAELALSIPDVTEGTEFENLGTTVEVVARQGNMTFDGVSYTLQQFHFHLPSEHLDNGTSMAMEMHMVWEGPNAEVAVVGVFVDLEDGAGGAGGEAAPAAPGGGNATTLEPLPASTPEARQVKAKDGFVKKLRKRAVEKQDKRQLPGIEGSFFHINAPSTAAVSSSALLETVLGSVGEISQPGTVTKTKPLVMSELVNILAAGSFQTYEGSLTTPPCSEGVRWLVSDQKLSIQTSTFTQVRSVIGFNSRFPQGELGEANLLSL